MNQKRLLVVSADHGFELLLKVHPFSATQTGLQRLQNFQYDLRNIGIVASGASGGKNPSSWILFPSLMLPMLVKTIVSADVLSVDVAPGSPINLKGISVGFEEVHLLQAARIYLDTQSEELVQLIFGSDFTDAAKNTRKVLARNIVGLYFSFDPEMRLLTMYVAARGSDSHPVVRTEQPAGWPSFAPPLSHEARRYRILVNTLIWRIRN